MSAKLDNRELQRQIGCMNGIFQLFDRHQPLTACRGRRTHKRLPASGQKNAKHPEYKSTKGEDKEEVAFLKQRNHNRRASFESPRTSFSSSISSSTFSSLDNNRTNQPESTTVLDFRGVVKDSIYKEPKGFTVKTTRDVNQTIKYVDSPRPILPYRPNERESSQSTLRSKYAPRFSYDGRESRDSWTSTVKLKELPRLSLDSKQSVKHVQSEEIHYRPSSVVAKLMGLEGLPNSVSVSTDMSFRQDENIHTKTRVLRSNYNQGSMSVNTSLPASSPHLRTDNAFATIKTSRFPLEPTFTKVEASTRSRSSPSIYGEIEKRLTDLEFKSSGKDLRALKQILEAMEKTRERLEVKNEEHISTLEHQNRKDCTNYGNPDQSTSLSSAMSHSQHNSYPSSPTSKRNVESSSIVVMKPAKFSERRISASSAMPISNNASSGLHKLRNSDAAAGVRGRKNVSAEKIQSPRESRVIRQHQSPLQNGHSIVQSTKTKEIHSLKLPPQPLPLSPRLLQHKKYHNNQPNDQSSSPGRKIKLKPSSSKKRDKAATATTTSQQGDTASVQSDSIVSQTDSEVRSTGNSEDIAEKLRKDATEFTTIEQPSPVSVLDTTFYREGSPSPVRKISNAFTDDATQNSEETEWSTVELDHLFNEEKLEYINQLVRKLRELNSTNDEPEETSYIPHNFNDQNPDHSYITQIILASGLLCKDLGAFKYSSSALQLKRPSDHLLNPSLFLVLEQTKGTIDPSNISEKIHRKLIFDIVNEILVKKMSNTSELYIYRPCITVDKVGQKSKSGQKLLKELCSEVDLLLAKTDSSLQDEDADNDDYLMGMLSEEITHKSGNWIDYISEFPALALDIERLIFKDLITEVVQGSSVVNKHFSH